MLLVSIFFILEDPLEDGGLLLKDVFYYYFIKFEIQTIIYIGLNLRAQRMYTTNKLIVKI